jgi:glutamine---fructose-6-phosphate transaminase (isomerizing)
MKSNFELEIYQQPQVIHRLLEAKREQMAELGERLRADPPRFLVIAARGTSDNAATYAKYVFGSVNRVPVALAMPSLTTLYNQTPDMTGGWVIGISQSGQPPDVVAVLKEARRQGAPTLAITNMAESPLAQTAEFSIVVEAGEEKSVAASKTYTAQLTAIAMLSAHWDGDPQRITDLSRLQGHLLAVLKVNEAVEAVAWRYRSKEQLVVLGRGYNHGTIHEIALKIKEMVYIITQAYSAADFRHGPIAMLQPDFPLVALAVKGAALEDMRAMVSEVQEGKADLALISNEQQLLDQVELSIPLPDDLPEWLSPIVAVVPGQLLALNLALVKGYDPDNPRGLSKVTRTL